MRKELVEGLSKEQIAKAKLCKNSEELLALAKEEGVALSEDQLAAVNGGFCSETKVKVKCPNCGAEFADEVYKGSREKTLGKFTCPNCGHDFSKLV